MEATVEGVGNSRGGRNAHSHMHQSHQLVKRDAGIKAYIPMIQR